MCSGAKEQSYPQVWAFSEECRRITDPDSAWDPDLVMLNRISIRVELSDKLIVLS